MVATPCNVVALAGKTLSANSLDLAWEVGPIVSCFANGIDGSFDPKVTAEVMLHDDVSVLIEWR